LEVSFFDDNLVFIRNNLKEIISDEDRQAKESDFHPKDRCKKD